MKLAVFIVVSLMSVNSFAGTLIIKVGANGTGHGSEVKYYNLENRSGSKFLYLHSKSDDACRVPLGLLKELGVDPLQAAHLLQNSGSLSPVFECHIPDAEAGTSRIADEVSFTTFPKP